MIEFVVFVILINIIFEVLKMLCPSSKLLGFVNSFMSILVIYLICLKIKSFF